MAQTTFSGPVVSQNGFADNSFTTAERDAIVNPQPGLLIYNTDNNTYEVYNGASFQPAFGGGPAPGGFPYTFTYAGKLSFPDKLYSIPTSGTSIQFINFGGSMQSAPMSTPWDVTTINPGAAVVGPPLSTYMGGRSPINGFAWKNDGFRAYVGGYDFNSNTTVIYEFLLGSAYDVTDVLTAIPGFSVPGELVSLTFGDNGTKLYAMAFGNGNITQYTLPGAYDVSTFTNVASFNIYTNFLLFNYPQQVTFNSTGTVGMVMNAGNTFNGVITQFELSSPWDINSINLSTYVNTNFSSNQIGYMASNGCVLKPDGSKLIFGAFDQSFTTCAFQYTTS